MNIKQTFKGVLSDTESRDRWVSRFTYWYSVRLDWSNICSRTQSEITAAFL